MEIRYPVCCGLDVHKRMLVACMRRAAEAGAVEKETKQFTTTVAGLLELSTWLAERQCPVVAMESTGVFWRPVYHALSGAFEVIVANPRDVRPRQGKKTDKADAAWIADLLAHGLVPQSFIPPPAIDGLRNMTRARVGLVQTRTQTKNRVHKILEDTCIKLASVVSDLFGTSARAMLDALVKGERDPKVLARMAVRGLKKKIPELEIALKGQFTDDHAFLIKLSLEHLDLLEAQLVALDERIASLVKPMTSEVELLDSIPGVDVRAARIILAEIGTDMSRFGSAGRLASWTALCPGNNESAGKRKSGRTRKGNRWLKRVLTECAWAARQTETHVGATFRRLEKRLGGKRAAVAVAHKILVIAYQLLKTGTFYDEGLYAHANSKREELRLKRHIAELRRAGFAVTPPPGSGDQQTAKHPAVPESPPQQAAPATQEQAA